MSLVTRMPSSDEDSSRNLGLEFFDPFLSSVAGSLPRFPEVDAEARMPRFLNVNRVGTFATNAAKNPSMEPSVLRWVWLIPLLRTGSRQMVMMIRPIPIEKRPISCSRLFAPYH